MSHQAVLSDNVEEEINLGLSDLRGYSLKRNTSVDGAILFRQMAREQGSIRK